MVLVDGVAGRVFCILEFEFPAGLFYCIRISGVSEFSRYVQDLVSGLVSKRW